MRPQPLICVTDVERSRSWYQALLDCESGHGGDEYERLIHDGPGGPDHREIWLRDPDGYLVVLASPDGESPGPDPRRPGEVPNRALRSSIRRRPGRAGRARPARGGRTVVRVG
jgi:hypothetical protein